MEQPNTIEVPHRVKRQVRLKDFKALLVRVKELERKLAESLGSAETVETDPVDPVVKPKRRRRTKAEMEQENTDA